VKTDIPAILGGKPAIRDEHAINCKWPILEEDDLAAVRKVLQDGDISTHPIRQELEAAYTKKFERNYAVSHNNGTSALFAAFFACELQEGDEVLVTSATWWASVLPMLWLGAVPVFCECEPEHFGISVDDMKSKLSSKTKALVVVHLWGMPSKMDEIQKFANEYNLKIIEDASHAHGASINGKPCGSFGDVSVFSLQGDKLSPAGEGGVLLTDDYDIYEKVLCFGDVTRIFQLETQARRFAATSFGVKTRMAPLSAAVGLSQLKKLDRHNKQRNSNIVFLSRQLEELGFETYMGNKKYKRTYFEFLIKWKPECGLAQAAFVKAMNAEGAQISAPRYPLIHQQPFFTEGHWNRLARLDNGLTQYDYNQVSLPLTERESQFMIRLPHFSTASQDFLDQYVTAFNKVCVHAKDINDSVR
jgi:dTDP-4-amino-4,6-dideoxygalactose transaminase